MQFKIASYLSTTNEKNVDSSILVISKLTSN